MIILGALSSVAEAVARIYAARGAAILLAGRRAPELASLAADLTVRGAASARVEVADLAGPDAGRGLAAMAAALGGADVILLAYGELTDEDRAASDLDYAARQWRVNALSPVLWSLAAAELLTRQGSGVLVVIGSVAGDRGRQSNYVYGSAKGMVAIFCQGLRNRLAPAGV